MTTEAISQESAIDEIAERVEILQTTDYSKFGFIQGNRDLVPSKIRRLKRSVENGLDLTPYCPIIVDGRLKIIDGQHRFRVCQELKKPVHYIIARNITIRQIAEMNSNTDKWSSENFLSCYCDLGIEDYKLLRAFRESYPFLSITECVCLLMGRSKIGGGALQTFKDGVFKVENSDYAHDVAEILEALRPHLEESRARVFTEAIAKLALSKGFDYKVLLQKLEQSRRKIEICGDVRKQCLHIEDLYNFHNQKRVIIYE